MHIVARNGHLTDAGVDYLTCTTRSLTGRAGFFVLADRWWSEHPEEGKVNDDAFTRGYRGRQTSRLFVGTRSDGAILRASGGAAGDLAVKAISFAQNVSRLDLQATVSTPQRTRDLARLAYGLLGKGVLRVGRSNTLTLIETNKGGRTLYIGRRSSDKYARLYDKGTESGVAPPRTLWRYEVELKRDVATQTAQALLQARSAQGKAAAMVYAHFHRRGFTPHYRPDSGAEIPPVAVRGSNLERRLRWLATQVRPVVAQCQPLVSDVTLARLLGLRLTDSDIGYAVLEGEKWVDTLLAQLIGPTSSSSA